MKKCLSQEMLKIIACLAMVIDHIGVVLLPWIGFRIIGRVAFPLYCFLLCQGAEHCRSPFRYGVRLALCALLAEIPYDLLFYGGIDWTHCNTMVTLLLSLPVAVAIKREAKIWLPLGIISVLVAELIGADYGGFGILMVMLFALPAKSETRLLTMALLCLATGEVIQLFALLSFVPIVLYSGRKATNSTVLQWGFYLFYPAHMMILWELKIGLP